MRQRRTMQAYYGTPQPVSFLDSVGQFFGNLGNNWQGGSDAPMYGGNPQGLPFATATGAYVAGQATADAAGNVASAVLTPVTGFLQGALRGTGVVIGLGIIAYTLINARGK